MNFESAPFVPVPEQDGSAVTLRFTYLGDRAGPELVAFNLWPRPLAIVMNDESFESLTPEQQNALVTAGANTFDPAMEAVQNDDRDSGQTLCESPIDVVQASDSDLAAFAAAFEPVYADLESDPHTARYIEEIRALKDDLRAPPDTFVCPAE